MKKLNDFFFGEDEVCITDFVWFYGMPVLLLLVTVVTIIPAWLQMINL